MDFFSHTSPAAPVLPSFDGSRREFATWLSQVRSIAFLAEPTLGCLACALFPPAEYQVMPRTGFIPAIPANPSAEPPQAAVPAVFSPLYVLPAFPAPHENNASNATVANFQAQQAAAQRARTAQNQFLIAIHRVLGPKVLAHLSGPNNDRPLYELDLSTTFTLLNSEYGQLRISDVDELLGELTSRGDLNLSDLIDRHRTIHRLLGQSGHIISEFDKVRHLRRLLVTSHPLAIHLFDNAARDPTTITFAQLEATLRAFRDDTPTVSGYAAAALVPPDAPFSPQQLAQLAVHFAAAAPVVPTRPTAISRFVSHYSSPFHAHFAAAP